VFLLALYADLDPPPKYKAWVQDHEVWTQTAAGDKELLLDPLAAEPAAVSSSGDRVVYAVVNPNFDAPHCGNTPQTYVALAKENGAPVWKVGFDEACQKFDKFEWIDDQRIGAMLCGHASCYYWVVDASSGKVLQKLSGGFDFLWSHNRKWVAHRMIGTGYEEGDGLLLNDGNVVAYPKPLPAKGYSNLGYLVWSPDDAWVSFAEIEYPSGDSFIVLVSPEGKVVREDLPVDVQYNTTVEWTDDSHVQITASGRTFRFLVKGGALHEIHGP
jgi:hypothetical protein